MKIYVVGKGYMDLNQFRLKYLDKYLILFCSNYESFLICASSGEIIDRIRLEFDSSEIHEEFINFIRNTY